MTDITTANLQRLLGQATPGPWEVGDTNSDVITDQNGDGVLWNTDQAAGWSHRDEDVSLAARAPELAQEVIRLRDGVEQIREMCLLERDAAFKLTPTHAAFNICAEQLTALLDGEEE